MSQGHFSRTIYVNNRKLICTTNTKNALELLPTCTSFAVFQKATSKQLNKAVRLLEKKKVKAALFLADTEDAINHCVNFKYLTVIAGGGIVINTEGKLLLIFRKGYWDLPKGKLDHGETIEECAVREVQEETGLTDVQITAPARTTYHTYHEKGHEILKQSHWYLMSSTDTHNLSPQKEEGIEVAKWVNIEEAKAILDDAYAIIKELINDFFLNKKTNT